jgi:hypothetical protein
MISFLDGRFRKKTSPMRKYGSHHTSCVGINVRTNVAKAVLWPLSIGETSIVMVSGTVNVHTGVCLYESVNVALTIEHM